MDVRHTLPSDHPGITNAIKEWWGGLDPTFFVPKIFLIHFCDTSYIVESKGEVIAFLIGFFSQSIEDQGYIHFTGVHPEFRKRKNAAD